MSDEKEFYDGYNYIDTQRDLMIDALVHIYGDKCFYCDGIFVNEQDHKFSRTIDHYFSQDYCKKNGFSFEETHGIQNCRLAHKVCNSNKSNREWLDDGTLAPRGRSRTPKTPRPELCTTCVSGRLLFLGETCPDCGSGPQPVAAPKVYQLSPRECNHTGINFCGYCFIGIVPRKTELKFGDLK